jgi:hypothetical protein
MQESTSPSPSMIHEPGQTNESEWIPLVARQGFVHTSNWRWRPEATMRNPLVVSDLPVGAYLQPLKPSRTGPSRLHLVTLPLDCQRLLPEDLGLASHWACFLRPISSLVLRCTVLMKL